MIDPGSGNTDQERQQESQEIIWLPAIGMSGFRDEHWGDVGWVKLGDSWNAKVLMRHLSREGEKEV